MSDVRTQIQTIIAEVLDQPDLVLTPGMTAHDIEGWDSLAHISLMFSIESHFGVTFSDTEMAQFERVDDLIELVQTKTGQT
ncbi:MAG: acyl carrier protein [Ornithinimicrobium sp.]